MSCVGYMLLFKAAFELGSAMGWELRHWALDWGQLGKMRLEAAGAHQDRLRHEPQGQGREGAASQGKEGANCLFL